jgi:hypothetical protein
MIKFIREFFAINDEIFYTLLFKFCSLFSNALVFFSIVKIFTPIEQGLYFVFLSIAAMNVCLELGFTTVMYQFFAHSRVNLIIDKNGVSGARKNLVEFSGYFKFGVIWIFIVSCIASVILFYVGKFILLKNANEIEVLKMWAPFIIGNSFLLIPLFFLSFIESIGFYKTVFKFRAFQIILLNGCLLLLLFFGYHLYSLFLTALLNFLTVAIWLFYNYRNLIKSLIKIPNKVRFLPYFHRIWPMHSRLSVGWISGFIGGQMIVPLTSYFKGPELAGKIGLSFSILTIIFGFSSSWIASHQRKFSGYFNLNTLNKILPKFYELKRNGLLFLLISIFSIIISLLVLNVCNFSFGKRFLDLTDFLILSLSFIFLYLQFCEASLVRAFKTEPFLTLYLATALITLFIQAVSLYFFDIRSYMVLFFIINALAYFLHNYLFKAYLKSRLIV